MGREEGVGWVDTLRPWWEGGERGCLGGTGEVAFAGWDRQLFWREVLVGHGTVG